VLDVLGQKRRNKHAALKLLRRLLRTKAFTPKPSRRTSWRRTAPRRGNLAFPDVTDPAGCAKTTAPKTRT